MISLPTIYREKCGICGLIISGENGDEVKRGMTEHEAIPAKGSHRFGDEDVGRANLSSGSCWFEALMEGQYRRVAIWESFHDKEHKPLYNVDEVDAEGRKKGMRAVVLAGDVRMVTITPGITLHAECRETF